MPEGEPVPVIKGSHVYLIDGSGYIFRAFHALPPLTRPSDGLPVGAVHGFCAMLWKLLQDARKGRGPTHLAVIFDASEKTFRNEIYKDYKAHRPPAPEELVPQFPLIRDAVKAFNIACIEQNGYEADDLIATYAREALAAGGDVTIVSSDKDLMQLVKPGVSMLDTMKNQTIGPDEVREKFGVPPDKVVDVQALAGDSTDNVPGVPGIGVKTAAELINEYGDLETLLARAQRDQAAQAPRAADRVRHAGAALPRPGHAQGGRAAGGARRAAGRARSGARHPAGIPARDGILDADQAHRRRPGRRGAAASRAGSRCRRRHSKGSRTAKSAKGEGPGAAVAAGLKAACAEKVDRTKYETVTDLARLEAWIAEARAAGRLAFDIETTSLDPMQAEFVGFSMAVAPGRACYVPLGHRVGAAASTSAKAI